MYSVHVQTKNSPQVAQVLGVHSLKHQHLLHVAMSNVLFDFCYSLSVIVEWSH